MAHSAVFYYPVRLKGDSDTLIYYAYETETEQGVSLMYDKRTHEAWAFADPEKAAACCRSLNARQTSLPQDLPPAALRFLFSSVGRLRYHEQHGQRFVVGALAPSAVKHAS